MEIKAIEEKFKAVSNFVVESIPEGYGKHQALVNLQQSVWWAIKGFVEDSPKPEAIKNDKIITP